MALPSSHVSSPGHTRPGTTCGHHYPTRHQFEGMERIKERGRVALSRQQKEMTRWKGEDQHHQENQAPPTKKGSHRHAAYMNKNDKGQIDWHKNLKH